MGFQIDEDRLNEAIDREFSCARCGNCCKGDGLVRFGAAEADRMAALLGLTRRRFVKEYAIRVEAEQWIMRDKMVDPPGGREREQWCIFLERGPDGLYGCGVNSAKPDQCASFPRAWRNDDTMQTCAGMRILMAKLRRRPPVQSEPEPDTVP